MNIALLVLLIVPVIFSFLDWGKGYYPFHVGVSGGCALLLLISAQRVEHIALIGGLCCSIVGDWFLHNKKRDDRFYLFGIAGFLLAHCCYIFHVLPRFQGAAFVWIAGLILIAIYCIFLSKRVQPRVDGMAMKIAVCAYALVSICAASLSIGLTGALIERALFSLGILLILISDTIIAESDFAGNRRFAALIMPTYYACHVLITASALIAAL